jgi:anti-anti-sigma factor
LFQLEPTTHEGSPALLLDGELTIYHVTEARDLLAAALDQEDTLRLNLSGLEALDSAGVQLLVWLKQEAHRRGRTLVLFAHSPAVLEVMDLLKVGNLFGDPILIAPSAS